MKRIALIDAPGDCASVALWDGASAWDPVAAGLCASTQDVTSRPDVGPGWSYSGGTWTAPAPPAPTPDPTAFMTAVFSDASIPIATRLALVPWKTAIADQIDNPGLIAAAWAALVASLSIAAGDQAAIHAHAVAYGIPGI